MSRQEIEIFVGVRGGFYTFRESSNAHTFKMKTEMHGLHFRLFNDIYPSIRNQISISSSSS
jgi:hypothetical protein